MSEITDTDRISWLAQDSENRLPDVRWRMINEGVDLRAAADWFIQKAAQAAVQAESPLIVRPRKGHPTYMVASDLLGGELILNSSPFSVELGADGKWHGEGEEIIAKALDHGGLTWPRYLKLSISAGSYSADTAFLAAMKIRRAAEQVKAAQTGIARGVLFPCSRLVITDAPPGTKLVGLFLFEIQ